MKIKKVLVLIISLAILIFVIAVISIFIKTKNKKEEAIITPNVETEKVNEEVIQEEMKKVTDEKVQEIMNDNVFGVVEKINSEIIVIKTEEGTTKEMSIKEGETFVISQINGNMENKNISDIKNGAKAFVHFEKETNLATNITLQ